MKENGYIAKDLCFDEDARQKLIDGISKMSSAVKSTLGPRGQTVIIESPDHTHGITVTKDGVTVARSINLYDPVENLAVKMLKQAASKTASIAGDGTTTAIVLTEALILAGLRHITDDINTTELIRVIRKKVDKLITMLESVSLDVTDDMLLDVATISANNDREIGEIIAETYIQVSRDGIVTVDKSKKSDTYSEVTNGIKVERGYSSPMFINNHRNDSCTLEDVSILVCDSEISNYMQIEHILKDVIENNKRLLIIGSCSVNMINTLAMNVKRSGLKICNIPPPSFGYRQHELMEDIALAVGAKYFSEKTGDDLSLILPKHLGHANRITVSKDSTIIITGDKVSEEAKVRIDELKEQQQRLTNKGDRDFVNKRIASLIGGIGCIYVGGDSDIEQKERFDRVEDSVCAVRSALDEGILPGGGLALWRMAPHIKPSYDDKYDEVSDKILRDMLLSPLKQILLNAGKDAGMIMDDDRVAKYEAWGYNVNTEQYGNMYEMGVIDPLKVTKNALINATSVATTILSTNAIITHARL